MQEFNPKKGWIGEGAKLAFDATMTVYHTINDSFVDCRIPEAYGSPNALSAELVNFREWLVDIENRLQRILEGCDDRISPTVSGALQIVRECLSAVNETLDQLTEAMTVLTSSTYSTSPMETVQLIADRFPEVVAKMARRRRPGEPLTMENEYDVQYLFEGLLCVPFSDIRPEESTSSVAGGSGRADTLLREERIVIEYKCTRVGLENRELRRQVAEDFLLYGQHADCDRLFVFVYDRDRRVTNPRGFETDLTVEVDGLSEVRIVLRS